MGFLGGWISKGKRHVSDRKPAEISNSRRNGHWKFKFLQNGQLKIQIPERMVAEIQVLIKESVEIMVFMDFTLVFSMKNQVFLWISRFFIWKTRFFYEKPGFPADSLIKTWISANLGCRIWIFSKSGGQNLPEFEFSAVLGARTWNFSWFLVQNLKEFEFSAWICLEFEISAGISDFWVDSWPTLVP